MNRKGFTIIELGCAFVPFIAIPLLTLLNEFLIESGINFIKAAQHQPFVDVPWWIGTLAILIEPMVLPAFFILWIVSLFI